MPEEAIAHDPMAYRYFDYPRTGSIYRLPDIPMIVRGKTYVQLPSGRNIEVDPEFKRDEPVPAAVHENGQAGASLETAHRKAHRRPPARIQSWRTLRPQHPKAAFTCT